MKHLTRFTMLCLIFVSFADHVSAAERPLITAQDKRTMIRANLSYHAPSVTIWLDKGTPSAEVTDLVHAGILKVRYHTVSYCQPRLALLMTEKGQRIAGSHGWSFDDEFLTIPVGRYVFVKSSSFLRRWSSDSYTLRFRYRYDGNFNVPYLLKMGKASDWNTGDKTTLADEGKVFTRTLPLQFSRERGWWLGERWHYIERLVC